MVHKRTRNISLTGIMIVSATLLAVLGATGAPAAAKTPTGGSGSAHGAVLAAAGSHSPAATPLTYRKFAAVRAAAGSHSPAATPLAYTKYYVGDDGGNNYYGFLADPGQQNQVYTTYEGQAAWTFVPTGAGFDSYVIHVNGGTDCLWADRPGGPVKDAACVAGDEFEWWIVEWPLIANAGVNSEDNYLYAASLSNRADVRLAGFNSRSRAEQWASVNCGC